MRILLLAVLTCCAASAAADPSVRTAEVGFVNLAYVDEGKGVPVVLVHGALGDWRSFEPLRPGLSREFRYIAYSRRYHQPNNWDDEGDNYTMSQHAEDVAELIRSLKLGKVHLFGTSYGGRVVAIVAMRNPELLRSVILGDPFLIDSETPAGVAARDAYNRDMQQVGKLVQEKKINEAVAAMYNAVNAPHYTFDRLPSQQKQLWMDNARTLTPMFNIAFPPQPTCAELSKISVPVLVLYGDKTRDYYSLSSARLKECLPKTTAFTVIPGASHMWITTSPSVSAEAIVKFARAH